MAEAVDATLGERAAQSPWVLEQRGLAESIALLEQDLLAERASMDDHVAHLARPGLIPPLRAVHYFTALSAAQFGWVMRRLPADLTNGLRPLREPGAWLTESVAYVLRDQLALLGPAGAELARILDESEGLAPSAMVDELRRRPLQSPPLPPPTVTRLLHRSFGGAIARTGEVVSATPISQLHRGTLRDGRRVFIRVRRPEVGRVIRQDARIGATLVGPLEWALPPVRDAHPLGFVELAARQLLEEADLRNEALNAVELGLTIEALGVDYLVACRPVAGLVDPMAVVFEAPDEFEDAVLLAAGTDRVDGAAAMPAFARVTIEAALALGVFHADLRPEQVLALADGRAGLIGYSTIGRLDRRTRRAALDWVVAVFSGDAAGQVEAMDEVGAISERTDVKRLISDLEGAESLQPMALMAGGETALMAAVQDGMRLFLRHRLRPPIELVLFVRTLLSLRALLRLVAPDRPITEALLPLLPRLPELRAQLAS